MSAKRDKSQFGLAHKAYLQGRINMREFRQVIRGEAKMYGCESIWRPFFGSKYLFKRAAWF